MNHYNDETRGTFQNTDYAKQLVSFDGLKFVGRNGLTNVTPTDIDGVVQLDNENCFIFFELKHSGRVPVGQSNALTKLVDAVQSGGVNCVLFVATHNTEYPTTIMAKDAIVQQIYWDGKWRPWANNRRLSDIMHSFINYIRKEDDCAAS